LSDAIKLKSGSGRLVVITIFSTLYPPSSSFPKVECDENDFLVFDEIICKWVLFNFDEDGVNFLLHFKIGNRQIVSRQILLGERFRVRHVKFTCQQNFLYYCLPGFLYWRVFPWQ